jgi:uncharacterized RDD family membrane protein YckC
MSTAVQVTCTTCRASLPYGSAFCTWCGTPVAPLTVVDPYQDAGGPGQAARRRDVRDDRQGAGRASGPRAQIARPGGALGPAFDGVTPARTGRRFGAFLIDSCAVWLIGAAVFLATGRVVPAALITVELAVGLVVWEARSGKTLGNAALGLRAARVETPLAPGLGRAVRRAAVMAVGQLVPVVGPALVVGSTAWDSSGRQAGWHDKAARSVVVDVRAMRHEAISERPAAFQAPVVVAPVAPVGPQPAPWSGVMDAAVRQPEPPVREPALPARQSEPPVRRAAASFPHVAPPAPRPARTVSEPAPVVSHVAPPVRAMAPAVPWDVLVDPEAGRRDRGGSRPPSQDAPPVPPEASPVRQPEPPVRQAPAPVRQQPQPIRQPEPPVRQALPPVRQPEPPVRQAQPVRQQPPVRQPEPPVRQAQEPARRPATSYALTLDTGQAMSVSGWGYIGRHPQPGAGERCNHVIEIDDPSRSLSRTHARFGIDSTGFWVEDRGSANGTSIARADGSSVKGRSGERLVVPPGGTVRLGDRTFTIRPLN